MADTLPPNAVFGSDGITIPAEIEVKNLSGTVADLNVLEQHLVQAQETMRVIGQMTSTLSENYAASAESADQTTEAVEEQLDAMTQLASITEQVSGHHKDIADASETVSIIKLQQIDRERELLALTKERAEAEREAANAAAEGSLVTGGPGQLGNIASSLGRYYQGQIGSRVQGAIPRSGMGGQLAGGLRALQGSGLAGAGGVLAGLGAAYLGYQTYSNLAQTQQQYSQLTGGTGMMEAQGYEIRARMMAIDPLLSTSQSRQIIQEALRQGYGGSEQFDNVTEFMASNMKKFGMSARESVKLYSTAIDDANVTLGELQGSMESLRDTAKEGGQGLEALMSSFQQNLGTLTGMGAGPGSAAAAQYITQAFAGIRSLEGVNLTAATSNVGFGQMLASRLGTTFTNLYPRLAELGAEPMGGGQIAEAYQGALRDLLLRSGFREGMGRDAIAQDAYRLLLILQQFGIPVSSQEQAVDLADAVLNGGMTTVSEQRETDVANVLTETYSGGAGNLMSTVGYAVKSAVGNAEQRTEAKMWSNYYDEKITGMANLPLIDMLFNSAYNMRDFSVVLPNGEQMELRDYLGSDAGPDAYLALQRGQIKIVGTEGKEKENVPQPMTLAEIFAPAAAEVQNAQGGTTSTTGGRTAGTQVGGWWNRTLSALSEVPSMTPTQTGVKIDLTEEAKRLINITTDDVAYNINQNAADYGMAERNAVP